MSQAKPSQAEAAGRTILDQIEASRAEDIDCGAPIDTQEKAMPGRREVVDPSKIGLNDWPHLTKPSETMAEILRRFAYESVEEPDA